MARPTNRPSPLWHDTLPWLATLPLWAAACSLQAQPLADPTRPPVLPGPAGSAVARASGAPTAASAARTPAAVLHGVQVPAGPNAGGAPTALVGARVLRIGDRQGERTLAAIDAQGVTWRSGRGELEREPLLAASIVKQTLDPATGTAEGALAPGEPPASARVTQRDRRVQP
jgi:hypothetical protein